MPDPIYSDPRLARIYDAFDGPRDDLSAYVAIAGGLAARRVVDLGCGTGCLPLLLATAGRDVTGVDPARASLEIARSKPGAELVTWVDGDAGAIPGDAHAELVLMTGNAAQTVLGDEDWAATLRHVRRALAPGGYFVFETRRPEWRAWEDWARVTPAAAVTVPGVGRVEELCEVTAVDLPLVSLRFTYRFLEDDTAVVSESTLRFRTRDEVAASLATEGFVVREVRDAPDRPGRELVFLASR